MNFLCIYLSEKGGGSALMHVYVREHIASLYYVTAKWMFTKLGRDEVFMARHMHKDVLTISAQGRIQDEAKWVTGRGDRKATATNQIHSNDKHVL